MSEDASPNASQEPVHTLVLHRRASATSHEPLPSSGGLDALRERALTAILQLNDVSALSSGSAAPTEVTHVRPPPGGERTIPDMGAPRVDDDTDLLTVFGADEEARDISREETLVNLRVRAPSRPKPELRPAEGWRAPEGLTSLEPQGSLRGESLQDVRLCIYAADPNLQIYLVHALRAFVRELRVASTMGELLRVAEVGCSDALVVVRPPEDGKSAAVITRCGVLMPGALFVLSDERAFDTTGVRERRGPPREWLEISGAILDMLLDVKSERPARSERW